MLKHGSIYLGMSETKQYLNLERDLEYANRRGLITGATRTGKTVSVHILTEGFSAAGAPLLCADVNGDVYDQSCNLESAYDILKVRAAQRALKQERQRFEQERLEQQEKYTKRRARQARAYHTTRSRSRTGLRCGTTRQSWLEKIISAFAREVTRSFGRFFVRGILGSLKR